MDPKTQTDRPAAKLPRGFADRGAPDIRAVERMMATIRAVYERYGFEPLETPFVEYTEALGKFLPDQDRPNEGVFSFQDDDGEWLSLRYDLTAPLARYVAQNYDSLPKPYRSYRAGWVFRNEKPGPGRFRQFMQFDADTVGTASPAADAEMCMMAADALEALGIERRQYIVKVNNRKFWDAYLDVIGVPQEQALRLKILRSIDKWDRLEEDGVRLLLGKGREDESGDFTAGAELPERQIEYIITFVVLFRNITPYIPEDEATEFEREFDFIIIDGERHYPSYRGLFGSLRDMIGHTDLGRQAIEETESLASLLLSSRYGPDQILVDPSVVRGLEYYTGPVFEAELTFEVPNEKGEPVVFGSVGGGGRYDGLVGRFRGKDVPATGFSIGVSRLAAALWLTGRLADGLDRGPVVVTVMERERLADYQRMTARLREELNRDLKPGQSPVPVEMYLGASGMKAQLKYADRRNAPCVVIQGSNEREAGQVQIKDLAAGKARAEAIADHQTWREERPGQFEVAEADLVEAVRGVLARQSGG
jgi:histidyl-tRNA synthetase